MLNKLLQSLRDEKDRYLNARKGSEFEERIMQHLQMTSGFTRVLKQDVDLYLLKNLALYSPSFLFSL